MSRAYLSIGSNLGDRQGYLRLAVDGIRENPHCRLLKKSSLYQTAPWGKLDQPDFLNAALILETDLAPLELLQFCQGLEQQAKRQRIEHWGARTLDVDIIAIDGIQQEDPRLILPHPHYRERLFVLQPLLELLGDVPLLPGEQSLGDLAGSCRSGEAAQLVDLATPAKDW